MKYDITPGTKYCIKYEKYEIKYKYDVKCDIKYVIKYAIAYVIKYDVNCVGLHIFLLHEHARARLPVTRARAPSRGVPAATLAQPTLPTAGLDGHGYTMPKHAKNVPNVPKTC